ncbi:MAG: hypothetical protein M3453_05445 [Pseudomonadota bacterium]|nr:hypothetical protein [Pseudomonadota bacterium]
MFLDSLSRDLRVRPGLANGGAEEGGLLVIRFDKDESPLRILYCRDRNDKPGKPGAAPEINPDAKFWRVLEELQAIGDVTRPDLPHRGTRDKIMHALPLGQQCDKPIEIRLGARGYETESVQRIACPADFRQRFGRPDPVFA